MVVVPDATAMELVLCTMNCPFVMVDAPAKESVAAAPVLAPTVISDSVLSSTLIVPPDTESVFPCPIETETSLEPVLTVKVPEIAAFKPRSMPELAVRAPFTFRVPVPEKVVGLVTVTAEAPVAT
jgi:hypothetical protein